MTTAQIKSNLQTLLNCRVYVKSYNGTYNQRGQKFVSIGFDNIGSEVACAKFSLAQTLFPNLVMASACQWDLRLN